MTTEVTMEKITALAKNRGFIFPGSEIYGGLANTWDYGPLGVELKNNIKDAWRQKFVRESEYNVGLDAAILMNPSRDMGRVRTCRWIRRSSDRLQSLQGPFSCRQADRRPSSCTGTDGCTGRWLVKRKAGAVHR